MRCNRRHSHIGSTIFARAPLKRGISEQTYDRVMGTVTPDTSVYAQFSAQPEVTELMWQYINRRCSEWRVITGKARAKQYAGRSCHALKRNTASIATF